MMSVISNQDIITFNEHGDPKLSRSYTLKFIGDWGGANGHVLFSWLTQEFCDRAGPRSRTSIWSLRDGGLDGAMQVENGEADIAFATPVGLMKKLVDGEGIVPRKMPRLRALGVVPQNDRMVLAIDPKYNIKTFDDLRNKAPGLRIATSTNDGTNFIGYVAEEYLKAHGLSQELLESWGAKVLTATRPEQCVAMVENGEADALLQEAIMTPWWRGLIDANKLVPLPVEKEALQKLEQKLGLKNNPLPKGFWKSLTADLPALDFSDFMLYVRDDLPEEVAYVLAWCLVETRNMLEARYRHLPSAQSPVTYPLEPKKMCQTPVELHAGAYKYYSQAGLL